MSKLYKALIIGAGQIGAFYDEPNSSAVLTHAHAYSMHKGFELCGLVDTDTIKAKKAADIWGTTAYDSIKLFFENNSVDIVSVCVTSGFQVEVLKDVANYAVKLVFCEKPFTLNETDAQEIIDLYKQKGIKLIVNFTRQFVPEFEQLQSEIASSVYGELINARAVYGKGLVNNASHIIDLLFWFFGDLDCASVNHFIEDYSGDPSYAFTLRHNNAEIKFDVVPSNLYTVFELDMFFEKGRVKILNSGNVIERYFTKECQKYRDYCFLEEHSTINTRLDKHMYDAIEKLYTCLNERVESPLVPSISHHQLINQIRRL